MWLIYWLSRLAGLDVQEEEKERSNQRKQNKKDWVGMTEDEEKEAVKGLVGNGAEG